MTTRALTVEIRWDKYKFLWLKYVTGFAPERHCAKCLVGKYDRAFPGGFRATPRTGDVFRTELAEADAPYFYLCGVARKWADNLHVAMRPAPGGVVRVEAPGALVVARGVALVAIPEPFRSPDVGAEFTTCRNWLWGRSVWGGPPIRVAEAEAAAQGRLF